MDVAVRIEQFNATREPERLALKFLAMRASVFLGRISKLAIHTRSP